MIVKDEYSYLLQEAENIRNNKELLNKEYLVDFLLSEAKNKEREVKSLLINCFLHMLKCEYQPEKTTRSWHMTILNCQTELEFALEDEIALFNKLNDVVSICYDKARNRVSRETGLSINNFPKKCPWSLSEVIDENFINNFLDNHPLTNNDTYY